MAVTRRLLPRSLVPADVARHRRRRLVHDADHQRLLRLRHYQDLRATSRDRRRRQPLDVRAPRLSSSRSTAACQFAGLATVGGNPSSVWINGQYDTGTFAHEFGHTFGLYHSHALNCHPSVVTPPCSIVEYGDTTDTMGGGTGHYNAFQKQRLGLARLQRVPAHHDGADQRRPTPSTPTNFPARAPKPCNPSRHDRPVVLRRVPAQCGLGHLSVPDRRLLHLATDTDRQQLPSRHDPGDVSPLG